MLLITPHMDGIQKNVLNEVCLLIVFFTNLLKYSDSSGWLYLKQRLNCCLYVSVNNES